VLKPAGKSDVSWLFGWPASWISRPGRARDLAVKGFVENGGGWRPPCRREKRGRKKRVFAGGVGGIDTSGCQSRRKRGWYWEKIQMGAQGAALTQGRRWVAGWGSCRLGEGGGSISNPLGLNKKGSGKSRGDRTCRLARCALLKLGGVGRRRLNWISASGGGLSSFGKLAG